MVGRKIIFAMEIVMDRLKVCTRCHQSKNLLKDFYSSKGKIRSECKKCTISRNSRYQSKMKSWRFRFVDNDVKRSYMSEYYRKNKEKFAQYQDNFRKKNPDYFKNYARERKNKLQKEENLRLVRRFSQNKDDQL